MAETLKAGQPGSSVSPSNINWFRAARFAMFITWGPAALRGGEISYSRYDRGGYGHGEIPTAEYDRLYKQFNPSKFDAGEIVKLAKAAGMEYLVFVTKHHDGFCMFDSTLTDHKITKSPWGRDPTAELARACHAAGLSFFPYYSPMDWHHADYRTANHHAYVDYMHGQVRELCSGYGPVTGLWFDTASSVASDWDAERLVRMIRELQPGALINNRLGVGFEGDYDTPEQNVGTAHLADGRDWETCATITGGHWNYNPKAKALPLKRILFLLIQSAGANGNLVLNISPTETGAIPADQVERLREIGDWMSRHASTIRDTRGGPLWPTPLAATTRRGRTVNLFILDWDLGPVRLPLIPGIVSSRVLTGEPVKIDNHKDSLVLTRESEAVNPAEPITIIELTLDRSAESLPLLTRWPATSLAAGARVTTSKGTPAPQLVDGDYSTVYDDSATSSSFEIDLGRPVRFDRLFLSEVYGGFDCSIREYAIRAWDGKSWTTFHSGGGVGEQFVVEFEPVTTDKIRFDLTKALATGLRLREFGIYKMAE